MQVGEGRHTAAEITGALLPESLRAASRNYIAVAFLTRKDRQRDRQTGTHTCAHSHRQNSTIGRD